jgi:hypothetical protein
MDNNDKLAAYRFNIGAKENPWRLGSSALPMHLSSRTFKLCGG